VVLAEHLGDRKSRGPLMLVARSVGGLAFLLAVLGVALFVPAGTTAWWPAWAFIAVFGGISAAITIDLYMRDPALLERRTHAGPIAETRPRQKLVQSLVLVAFLACFLLPGLDVRRHGVTWPAAISIAGDLVVAAGLGFVWRVFRENSFASSTVEVARDQRVIDTGPYAVVRHPMYSGAIVFVVAIPLALGSWWGYAGVVGVIAAIIVRIFDEEQALVTELPGYAAYRERVRYRLVPRVW
jgi:protein-S-isoprenylcysteine O-methyltransferase Ste14